MTSAGKSIEDSEVKLSPGWMSLPRKPGVAAASPPAANGNGTGIEKDSAAARLLTKPAAGTKVLAGSTPVRYDKRDLLVPQRAGVTMTRGVHDHALAPSKDGHAPAFTGSEYDDDGSVAALGARPMKSKLGSASAVDPGSGSMTRDNSGSGQRRGITPAEPIINPRPGVAAILGDRSVSKGSASSSGTTSQAQLPKTSGHGDRSFWPATATATSTDRPSGTGPPAAERKPLPLRPRTVTTTAAPTAAPEDKPSSQWPRTRGTADTDHNWRATGTATSPPKVSTNPFAQQNPPLTRNGRDLSSLRSRPTPSEVDRERQRRERYEPDKDVQAKSLEDMKDDTTLQDDTRKIWQYRDPRGRVQGPFSAAQLMDWLKAGYYQDDLQIKRVEDSQFEDLGILFGLRAQEATLPPGFDDPAATPQTAVADEAEESSEKADPDSSDFVDQPPCEPIPTSASTAQAAADGTSSAQDQETTTEPVAGPDLGRFDEQRNSAVGDIAQTDDYVAMASNSPTNAFPFAGSTAEAAVGQQGVQIDTMNTDTRHQTSNFQDEASVQMPLFGSTVPLSRSVGHETSFFPRDVRSHTTYPDNIMLMDPAIAHASFARAQSQSESRSALNNTGMMSAGVPPVNSFWRSAAERPSTTVPAGPPTSIPPPEAWTMEQQVKQQNQLQLRLQQMHMSYNGTQERIGTEYGGIANSVPRTSVFSNQGQFNLETRPAQFAAHEDPRTDRPDKLNDENVIGIAPDAGSGENPLWMASQKVAERGPDSTNVGASDVPEEESLSDRASTDKTHASRLQDSKSVDEDLIARVERTRISSELDSNRPKDDVWSQSPSHETVDSSRDSTSVEDAEGSRLREKTDSNGEPARPALVLEASVAPWNKGFGANAGPSLLEIQQEEAKRRHQELVDKASLAQAQAQAQAQAAAQSSVPAHAQSRGSAWGGATLAQPIAASSLREQMRIEEERRKAQMTEASSKRVTPQTTASPWLARVTGGGTRPPVPTPAPRPAPSVQPEKRQSSSLQKESEAMFWDVASRKPATARTEPVATTAKSTRSGSQTRKKESAETNQENSDFSAFGIKMSPEFKSWCREQLYNLTGSKDTTLTEFLLSLSSPGEIKDYVQEYLGSSLKASTFAEDFIRRKEFETGEEEWKSTGKRSVAGDGMSVSQSGKKKGKRRGAKLDPSLLGFTTTSNRIMQGTIEDPE